MLRRQQITRTLLVAAGMAVLSNSGCGLPLPGLGHGGGSATPLGTLSDPVWQNQERNAEKSDFVIHEHEFIADAEFLNTFGEDHLRQIALRLSNGQDSMVLIERSKTSARPDTEHKYPVHRNPDLDMRRRELVARCLAAMGVPYPDTRVVVAPDLAPQYRSGEIAATYYDDAGWDNNNRGGFGGGMGGGFGGGSGGGFSANPTPSGNSYAGGAGPSVPMANETQGYRR